MFAPSDYQKTISKKKKKKRIVERTRGVSVREEGQRGCLNKSNPY